jgi:hypothetical protein
MKFPHLLRDFHGGCLCHARLRHRPLGHPQKNGAADILDAAPTLELPMKVKFF